MLKVFSSLEIQAGFCNTSYEVSEGEDVCVCVELEGVLERPLGDINIEGNVMY